MATILVVEDEVLIQMLLADYLDELGFATAIAGSAEEARGRMRALGGVAAAAVVDVGLPDAPHGELVDELRANHPALPILVATGHNEASLRQRFAGQAGMGYLGKPYTLADLETALRAIRVLA